MEEPQPSAAPVEGAITAQPVTDAQPVAGTPQEPVSQTETNATPSLDDTADWLSKKGIDPSDPDAVGKLAKSYREAEKLAMSATREASELRKSLNPQSEELNQNIGEQNGNPEISEFMQDYRRDKLISGFKQSHDDWQEHEPAMAQILNQQVNTAYGAMTRSQLVNAGILSLEDVYTMAKASSPVNTDQVKAETRQEVLQTLANTQRAGGSAGNASNPNTRAQSGNSLSELESRLSNHTF